MKKSSYPRQGFITTGLATKNNECYEKEQKKVNVQSNDTKMREYVRNRIDNMVKEGIELTEATKLIAQEKIVKEQFKYLTQHGIVLEKVFANWYNQYIKNKDIKDLLGR